MQKATCNSRQIDLHHVHHDCTTVHKVQRQSCTAAPHRTTPLKGWCSGAVVQPQDAGKRDFLHVQSGAREDWPTCNFQHDQSATFTRTRETKFVDHHHGNAKP